MKVPNPLEMIQFTVAFKIKEDLAFVLRVDMVLKIMVMKYIEPE